MDINKPLSFIPCNLCDTNEKNAFVHEYIIKSSPTHFYSDKWINIASDEVLCRNHYEPFIFAWGVCYLISIVLSSLIILVAIFIPTCDPIDKIKDRLIDYKTCQEDDPELLKHTEKAILGSLS